MAHVRPGVERLDESRQGDARRPRPPESGDVGVHPELERLGLGGLDRLHHLAPARIARHDLAADVGDGADPHAEDHAVEILPYLERPGAYLATVLERLEVPPLALQALAVLQLGEIGPRGPAGEAADVDQRLVFTASG